MTSVPRTLTAKEVIDKIMLEAKLNGTWVTIDTGDNICAIESISIVHDDGPEHPAFITIKLGQPLGDIGHG